MSEDTRPYAALKFMQDLFSAKCACLHRHHVSTHYSTSSLQVVYVVRIPACASKFVSDRRNRILRLITLNHGMVSLVSFGTLSRPAHTSCLRASPTWADTTWHKKKCHAACAGLHTTRRSRFWCGVISISVTSSICYDIDRGV